VSERREREVVTDLLVDDEEGVRTITFNRPESKNALTLRMRQEFCAELDAADRDPRVRAVIVTGTDPSFSAGVDFKDIDPAFDPRERRFTVNPGRALRAMRTPVLCAVNGACISGGLEIALSASFIVASDRATFADTHARLGVVPGWGLSALLPRAVGIRKAREMSMTGNFVDANEALRLGLVNHVVAHEDLLTVTRKLADDIADTPAVGEVLSLYEQGEDLDLNAALAVEMTRFASLAWDSAAFTASGRATAAREHET
jgi:enoyl-CoA hydratase